MTRLKQAIELAKRVHKGQVDKAGVDYIQHPLSVSKRCTTQSGKIVGVLHDVLEDGEDKASILKEVTILLTEEELEALILLTKKTELTYSEYILSILKSPIAIEVKLSDLEENLRYDRGDISDSLRKRYETSYAKIKQETLK